MYSTRIIQLALPLLLLLGFLVPALSFAQTTTTAIATAPTTVCVSLPNDIWRGMTDGSSNGAVTSLQNFLVEQGDFSSTNLGTGSFGPLTFAAVVKFQAAHGIPQTGYVGPLTRAAIGTLGCGTLPVSINAPNLYSISPSAAAVGTVVSVTGFGFTGDNTILMDGLVAARNVPIASSIALSCTTSPTCHGGINQTLSFTIPTSIAPNCAVDMVCPMFLREVTPGQYSVTVQNVNGTSGPLPFTVTTASGGPPLSITGIDAPATLALGQSGTWTVNVLAGTGTGNLHYSVVWGDEGATPNTSIAATSQTSTQTSASFTHTYAQAGTYTAIFVVSDDSGQTQTVSSTVTVTPLY